ncbi:lysylphosphatidylglycerol synthase transmembrane domain-containing protein [Acanthopleuribacter pedis]|uniref:Flippase-like domain-containing protein n=1 Tax=Acanthopleuribacter pedis TaxID=442870 RepID=A0A8J7U6B4_9BACT|nr:lysylphosphatidylglycerol synthase transmembrane domain-containing protein [Acanthopleuribacter pedis]MBO1320196.1 flippase-like domain-containing protein [Acanthopleuribacter pedis]
MQQSHVSPHSAAGAFKRHAATLAGLVIGFIFLYLAFAKVDLSEVWRQISNLALYQTLIATALTLSALLLRGLRWWYLFPRPHRRGELWQSIRALSIGYGVTNVASRLGEVVRVVSFYRRTDRDIGAVSATVVLDRILLDLSVFALLVGFSMTVFHERLTTLFPSAASALWALTGLIGLGLAGLFWTAAAPASLKKLVAFTGLPRFPAVWQRLENLIDQVSGGLTVMTSPSAYLGLFAVNTAAWGASILMLGYIMTLFGVAARPAEVLLIFAVSNLGMILPSPGGIGTYHYFTALGLTRLMGVDEVTASALAAYAHGISYISYSLFALVAWLIPGEKPAATAAASAELV